MALFKETSTCPILLIYLVNRTAFNIFSTTFMLETELHKSTSCDEDKISIIINAAV